MTKDLMRCGVALAFCLQLTASFVYGQESTADLIKAFHKATTFDKRVELAIAVAPGTDQEARDYYQRISKPEHLNFDFLPDSNLNDLLVYLGYAASDDSMGYQGLLASDLETLPSFLLMPRDSSEFSALEDTISDNNPARMGLDGVIDLAAFQNGNVLVSRFFAPKITTYFYADTPQTPQREDNEPIDRDDIQPLNGAGWRKLVRLKPQPMSEANARGVRHVYVLFNFKAKDPAIDPYDGNQSGNNQVIIVPEDQDAADSAYFAVYRSGFQDDYKIGLFLQADFDLPGQNAVGGQYFVPRACAECHGHSTSLLEADQGIANMKGEPVDSNGDKTNDFSTGIYRFAKPNYLDTDQWYDWMEFDYRQAVSGLNDVVFDGSKDHGSPAYQRAFAVIRDVNRDVRDETFQAERTASKSYQTLAVEKWNSLHQSDSNRKPYSMRSIGAETWDPNDPEEMTLLRLLNNHCFRCHSSLRYSVFDKASFRIENSGLTRKGLARLFLEKANANGVGFVMPQGRVLLPEEKLELIRLLDEVFGP